MREIPSSLTYLTHRFSFLLSFLVGRVLNMAEQRNDLWEEFLMEFSDSGQEMKRLKTVNYEKITKIEGFYDNELGQIIAGLASQVSSDHCIVEIGGYRGKSSCFLADGSREGNGASVYVIDKWDFDTKRNRAERYLSEKTYQTFLENIQPFSDYICHVKGISEEVAKAWSRPIGLLHIDGDHSVEGCKKDYDSWSPFVVNGGWIAFHDYYDRKTGKKPGVALTIEKVLIPSGLWEDYFIYKHLFVARRRRT